VHVVLDASIVVTVISGISTQAADIRAWLTDQIGDDRAHILRQLTPLEVTSALRRLASNGEIAADWATACIRRIFGWPYVREELTQPQLRVPGVPRKTGLTPP